MRLVTLCLALLVTAAAAPQASPDGARALAGQLRGWFTAMLGPDAPVVPVRAEVEGDHYRVIVPIVGLRTPAGAPELTAAARPLDDGRWKIDDVRLPNRFIVSRPAMAGMPAGETVVTVGDQHAHGLVDPSLGTESSFAFDGTGLVATTKDAGKVQEQQIDRYGASGTVTPGPGGLLSIGEQAELDGWRSGVMLPSGLATASAARKATASVKIDGLNREQMAPALAALVRLGTGVSAASPGGKDSHTPSLTPEGQAALHQLVAALRGIVTSLRLEETLEGVQVEIAGLGAAAVDKARLGIGGESKGGLVRAWLDLGVEGLSIPGLPAGEAALVPRVVSFRPSVSGVPSEALNQLMAKATEPGADVTGGLDKEIAALFAQGSLTVGVDALNFVIGPARFAGAGSVLLLSPTEYEGQARVSVTGFDKLTEQARGDARLEQALPILIMARGLAKPDGDALVWSIAADRSGKVTVNGMDLSALGGGKAK